jgi:GxxExxY protein
MRKALKRNDLIYPELSYKIVGCLFEVFNNLGSGHREKFYQKALAFELKNQAIKFIKEFPMDLHYKGQVLGKNYLDFFIDDMIVLEIKVGKHFTKQSFDQVYDYLKLKNLKLGIIANFKNEGVKIHRIINFNNSNIRS